MHFLEDSLGFLHNHICFHVSEALGTFSENAQESHVFSRAGGSLGDARMLLGSQESHVFSRVGRPGDTRRKLWGHAFSEGFAGIPL